MGSAITFNSEHATVEVAQEKSLVRLIWKGNASGDAYRAPSLAVLDAVQGRQLKYFLSDARGMGPILFADRNWSETQVIPKLIAGGLERIAIVSSSDGLNLIAVDKMVNTIPMGTATVGFFEDPAAAEDWLLHGDRSEVADRRSDNRS